VCELLRRPEVRLLTLMVLVCWKTRSVCRSPLALSKDFAGQVCFISLMETSDPEARRPTIAKALGLQELGNQPTLDLLIASLKEKHCSCC